MKKTTNTTKFILLSGIALTLCTNQSVSARDREDRYHKNYDENYEHHHDERRGLIGTALFLPVGTTKAVVGVEHPYESRHERRERRRKERRERHRERRLEKSNNE